MRFGALGKTVINQPEVALGILPGGTGTQRLPRLVGRGRALELILGCEDLDAASAERWGLLNRALPPAELGPSWNASRAASRPSPRRPSPGRSAPCSPPSPAARPGSSTRASASSSCLRTPEAQRRMRRFLERGGQTREGEKRLGELCVELADRTAQN